MYLICFSDDLDFPRSWLLPVIRDNVQETELAFFTSYFLPLAVKLRQRCKFRGQLQSNSL